MGAQSRVGRPRKNTHRVELRLNADDPATKALIQEAQRRHVTLQQHIADILIARALAQPGPTLEPQPTTDALSALVDEWM